ncbi:lactate utilization protein [Chloroflexota bacterium]
MGKNDEREKIEITLAALKRRGFDARFAENREIARKMVLDLVPEDWIVGCGDSSTIRSIGVPQDLVDLGHEVLRYGRFYKPKINREKEQPAPSPTGEDRPLGCDAFLASAHVTEDGKIVNIDGSGNRIVGIICGGRRGILVVGRNKIVKDVEEALYRIKNVVCSLHSKTTGIGKGMLCAAAGKCVEPEVFCDPGEIRACNVVLILEATPDHREIVVILVDEDLGLGFDPAWPQERKDKIYAEYQEFTPPHSPVYR